MIIGYARVSSSDQDFARQIKDLEEFGCDRIFSGNLSDSNLESRIGYKDMRKQLGFNDVLVVKDLSCLGRNTKEIRDEWESLMKNEVDVIVLDIPFLDTRKYKENEKVSRLITEIILSILSWMVEKENDQIRTAQREGIEIAKKQGKYRGRKKKYHAEATGEDKLMYETIIEELNKDTSIMDIHRKTGVARSTIYNIKKEINNNKNII